MAGSGYEKLTTPTELARGCGPVTKPDCWLALAVFVCVAAVGTGGGGGGRVGAALGALATGFRGLDTL